MNIPHYLALPALTAVLLGASAPAFAQTAPPSAPAAPAAQGQMHHHRSGMRRALEAAGLNADQKTQIKGLMKSYRDSQQSATPETRQQLRTQVEGVLNADQRSRFEAAMQQTHGVPAPAASPTP